MFAIIGIDGATPSFILENRKKLPTFDQLIDKYGIGILCSPYKPITSAKCWTTIFTGVGPEKHGVLDFITNDKLIRRSDIKATFAWELLEDQGLKVVALNIVATLPPINYNCKMMEWLPNNLAISEEEMSKSTETLLSRSLEILEQKPDFFAVVFPSIDRASHLFWGTEKVVNRYISIDSALDKILENFDGDFMLVSDHGFQNINQAVISECEEDLDAQRKGGHHPDGIILSNFLPKPETLTEVTPTIYRRLLKSK